MMENTENDSNG